MNLTRRDWIRMSLAAFISSCTPERLSASSDSIFTKVEPPSEQSPITAELISKEENQPILETVLAMFHPSLRPYLDTVLIVKDNMVRTAEAVTSRQFSSSQEHAAIKVSPDWDAKAQDSKYWSTYFSKAPYDLKPEDPVFSDDFKINLLVHEYMHLIQDHLRLDPPSFFQQVERWYRDKKFGRPGPEGIYLGRKSGSNRMKYLLWWNLYGKAGNPADEHDVGWQRMNYHGDYPGSTPGVEEFAYIGGNIAIEIEEWRRKDRLAELSLDIIAAYQNVLNPALW